LDPNWEEVDAKFKDAAADELRSEGLFLHTVLEWDVQRKVATTWIEENFVDGIDNAYWAITLVRTDIWEPIGSAVSPVKVSVTRGEVWA